MSKAMCVIGSAYGDCGKGLMTDYFSSLEKDTIVVRSNGGAQAGHTVHTPEGQRHIFSHVGAGTYNGSSTYLSEYFVANPLLFKKEMEACENPESMEIYAHPDMLITTPFDMLINQQFEVDRDSTGLVHGSVGVGFGETIERALVFSSLTYGDLLYWRSFGDASFEKTLFNYLNWIRKDYVPTRVNLNHVNSNFIQILNEDDLITGAISHTNYMMDIIKLAGYDILQDRTLVFEGAQGLLLDMDYGYFPHVTRSNCGMKNISAILNKVEGPHDITANYVTRAYTTRHGAGPLDGEDPRLRMGHNIQDPTNIENEWQGKLRFAPLNYDLFNSITDKDFLNYAPRSAKKVTTITCLDQMHGEVCPVIGGVSKMYSSINFRNMFAPKEFDFTSSGFTRNTVVDISAEG